MLTALFEIIGAAVDGEAVTSATNVGVLSAGGLSKGSGEDDGRQHGTN